MINGIINVRKEAGYTSHDVVAKLRGILKQKKIGHTGTLDPDATGVLPVCIGKATRLCDVIGDWKKTYEATLLLGQTTDTEDISGNVLSTKPVNITEEEITRILKSFAGDYDQIPPMYSAKKIKGRRLYELARAGLTVERKPCRVHIFSLEIKSIELPQVTFSVTCSKGTYLRSLCRDVGERAGCGGCMAGLKRTAVESFDITDSFSLAEIEAARDAQSLDTVIRTIDSVFMDYQELTITGRALKLLLNGNPIPLSWIDGQSDFKGSDIFRLYDSGKHFIGLYKRNPHKKRMEPYKLFFDI